MGLNISYEKTKNAQEAYDSVKRAITPETIAQFNVKADLDYIDDQKRILAKGKGFDLDMSFYDTEVSINLDLSFMLKPFRSNVEKILTKKLSKVL